VGIASTFFQGLRETAEVGVDAFARQQAAAPVKGKGKKRRAKKAEECSPCEAMDRVDQARARVKDGAL